MDDSELCAALEWLGNVRYGKLGNFKIASFITQKLQISSSKWEFGMNLRDLIYSQQSGQPDSQHSTSGRPKAINSRLVTSGAPTRATKQTQESSSEDSGDEDDSVEVDIEVPQKR